MALTTAQIQNAYVAFFNRPADVAGLNYWSAYTGSLSDLYNTFAQSAEYTSVYNTLNNSQRVNTVYTNLLGHAPDTAGLNYWVLQLDQGKLSLANLALAVVNGAQGTDASVVTNKVSAATSYTTSLDTAAKILAYATAGTTSMTAVKTWLGTVTDTAASLTSATSSTTLTTLNTTVSTGSTSNTGSTFTLTTGIDTLVGTSADDTFQGLEANWGALDSINGGTGTDNLVLALTSATNTLSSAQISNIETVTISQNTNDSTNTALSGLSGVTTVANSGSTKALVVTGLSSIAATSVTNVTTAGANTTFQFTEAAVAGTTDAATLTVNGVTSALQVNMDTATANTTGLETINLVSSGSSANSITLQTNDTAGLATVNVSGSAALTLAMGTNLTTTAKTINASSATGNVTVTGLGAAVHTVTGGSGADSFAFAANFVGAENATVANRDTVNGGAGRDTLSMNVAQASAASAVAQSTVTNIEILTIADAWTTGLNIDATRFTGVDAVNLAAGTAGTSTLTVASGTAVTLAGDSAANSVTSFAVAGTGITDTMTLNMAGFDFAGTGTETFTGIETLNISTGSTVTDAATFAAALTVTPSAGLTNGNIVVTGANAMTFTGVVTAGSIDASALTGILTVTAAAANGITIKGGTKADVINGSAVADLITGNDGADVITAAGGNDSIVLTETTAAVDKVVFGTHAANGTDTITGFTGGTGGDTLNIAALGDGTTPNTNTATISAAAAQGALVDDTYYIINTTGAAANLTTAGTAAVTDWTNLTQVAAYLAERFTLAGGDDEAVVVVNVGTTSSYVYSLVDADNTLAAADLALVGVVTTTAALTTANIVVA